eukprot:jgi/Hompol1/6748/HPOL_001192-RA
MAMSTLLIESEAQAKTRSQVGEKLIATITDFIKDFNKEKMAMTKRNLDFCIKYQQELWLAYEDLDKMKLAYEKAAKEDDAAQKKYDDAVKRPKSGLQALKNLVTGKDAEERIQKVRLLKSKWKTKTRQLNDARNDYLIAVAGTNAIQDRYYKEDIHIVMERIDGDYYKTINRLLHEYTTLETSVSQSTKLSADRVETEVAKVDRQRENREIVVDEASKTTLGQRLGEFIVRDEALSTAISQREKELAGVIQMAEAYAATPQFGNAATPLEGDAVEVLAAAVDGRTKIRNIRTGATGFVPSSSLKAVDITVPEGGGSSSKLPTYSTVQANQDYEATDEGELSFKAGDTIECLDGIYADEEWWDGRVVRTGQTGTFPVRMTLGWEAVAKANVNRPKMTRAASARRAASMIGKRGGERKPAQVRAIYSYEATCDGELTIEAGEIITIVNKDTGSEAWWEGQGKHGRGQFPVNYVQPFDDQEQNESKGMLVATSGSKSSMGVLSEVEQVRALYDFTATAAGELTFKAGDVIKVTQSKDQDWWDGEFQGQFGAFPAAYVERI